MSLIEKSAASNGRSSKEKSFLEKYMDWGEKEYEKLSDAQICSENRKLKKELVKLNYEVGNMIQRNENIIHSNINKIMPNKKASRAKTELTATSHEKSQQSKRLQSEFTSNASSLLVHQKDYERLKRREQDIFTIESKEECEESENVLAHYRVIEKIQESIDEAHKMIDKIKKENKELHFENFMIGKNTEESDEFLESMKRLHEELEFETKRKKALCQKIQLAKEKQSKLNEKTNEIEPNYKNANQYLFSIKSTLKEEMITNQRRDQLAKDSETKSTISKLKRSENQCRMMKYHQLLKQLENIVHSISSINSRIDTAETESINLKLEISQNQAILTATQKRKKISNHKLILNQTDIFNEDQEEFHEIRVKTKSQREQLPGVEFRKVPRKRERQIIWEENGDYIYLRNMNCKSREKEEVSNISHVSSLITEI